AWCNEARSVLSCLRVVAEPRGGAVVVLGNHDLHLVTQHEGFAKPRKDDTFTDVLDAPDRRELVDWLRTRPMMHAEGNCTMVHAGLVPQWSVNKALGLAKEVETALAGRGYRDFLAHLYGRQAHE